MGILDPWREARAGILAQPYVAPEPWVNPGYNLPDHPNAPYRPTPEVNEEVVAATQAAGTPYDPRWRRPEEQQISEGHDGSEIGPKGFSHLSDAELSQQLSSSMDDKHNPKNNSALRGLHNMTGGYLSGPKSLGRVGLAPAAALANLMAGEQLQGLWNEQALRNQRRDVNQMHNYTQQGVSPGYTPGPPPNPNFKSLTPVPVTVQQLLPLPSIPQPYTHSDGGGGYSGGGHQSENDDGSISDGWGGGE